MTEKRTGPRYVSETITDGIRVSFEADEVLHEDATAHHRLELIRNRVFGTTLVLDGAVQVTSADEFMYHEMMAHVPLVAHGNARDVLVVGGGDCGLAEEVLKHKSVRRLVQVEIDQTILDFAREHFSEFNAPVFADERFHVEIGDGADYAASATSRFDVILIDSTDPEGPGARLFTESFYRDLRRCLRPGGIVVTQSGVPFLQPREFEASMHGLARAFETATCYVVAVPSYFGGHMTLGWASDSNELLVVPVETLKARAQAITTRYYTPAVHRAAFALPRYIEEIVETARGGR